MNKTPPLKYFLYARKSSEAEDRQAASIDAQKDELIKIAKDQNLAIVEILVESQSAKKPGRPIFNKMLERIYKGEANGIICWKLDRLARNPVDGGQISWMLQQSAIAEIVTYGRTYYPTDNVLMMQVELGMANQYIRDLSVNVKRGLAKKVREGWLPSMCPIGYMSTPDREKGFKTITKDLDRFTIVRHIFDLMLTGNYTVPQVWDISRKKLNLTTYKRRNLGGKHLSKSGMYAVLSNPFYYGWFEYPFRSGEWHKGAHEAMITEDEFNKIQQYMGRSNRPSLKKNLTFAFTGLMHCGSCGCSITAQAKVKRCKNGNVHHYVYYNCTKKKVDVKCPEKVVELKNLEIDIKEKLSEITISERFKEWAIRHLHELRKTEADTDSLVLKGKNKELEEVTKNLQSLTLNFTSPRNQDRALITDDEYQNLKGGMVKRKLILEDDLKITNKQVLEWVELTEKTFDFACYAHIWFEKGDEKTKRAILACLGSNLTIKGKKVFVNYHSFIKTIIKSRQAVEAELEHARTSNVSSNKRQNPALCEVSSLGLDIVRDIGTFWKLDPLVAYLPNLRDGLYPVVRPTEAEMAKYK